MNETADTRPRRTDGRTFLVRAAMLASQLVLPIVLGGMAILDKGEFDDLLTYFLPIVVLAVGANIAIAYLRWTRFTYAVGESDIRVESGLLSRAARSVPFERIQDVSLEQKPIPRLFGLVEVKFETGAGAGDDLKLAYLSEVEGERLRELVRARRDGPIAATEPDPVSGRDGESRVLFAMPPRRVVTFGLFEFSLAVVAAAIGAAQQFDFLLPFDPWDIDGWQGRLEGSGHWLAGLGVLAQAVGVLVAIAVLLSIGLATGLVRTVLRDWDFRLERTDKGLRRRRGLLTRTDLVMPIHRVQALRIGTGLVRRRFGWYSLKLVSLANDSGSANHEAVPFARMDEITPVVAETGFDLPSGALEWRRSSIAYRFDRTLTGGAALFLVALATLAAGRWDLAWIPPLLGGAAIGLHEYLRWRHDRHALDTRQVYTRHGWLAPSLAIASREKLQSVQIVQGPIARLRGYADLRFGLAGGKLRMRGLPLTDARAIAAAVLDSMGRRDFSAIVESPAEDAPLSRRIRRAGPPIPGAA